MAYPSPITLDTRFFTGEDKTLSFVIYDASGYATARAAQAAIASGTAVRQDITGFDLSYMIKRSRSDADADALVTRLIGDGVTITSGEDGEGEVELSAEDLAAIAAERHYYHELKRIDVGFRTVLTYGLFVLNDAVHDGPEPST